MNARQLGQQLNAMWTTGGWWRTSTQYCHGGDNPTDLVFRDGKDGRLIVHCHSKGCHNWSCKCCKDGYEVTDQVRLGHRRLEIVNSLIEQAHREPVLGLEDVDLHSAALNVLRQSEGRHIQLPSLTAYRGQRITWSHGQIPPHLSHQAYIWEVHTEHEVLNGRRQVDALLVASPKQGNNLPQKNMRDEIGVEVAVTNSKRGSFAEDMREASLSCFEVRLSKDSIAQRMAETNKSFDAVLRRTLLTDVNNKIWLFNRKFGIPKYG